MDAPEHLAAMSASEAFNTLTGYTKAFDLFKAMGVSTRELVHSNIIASLLNDREAHGMGSAFRDDYVRSLLGCRCERNPLPEAVLSSTADVRANVTRELEHIDILLDYPSLKLVIAIENKIWALDQSRQVARYQEALQDLFPHYTHRALVYLTPKGRASPTIDPDSPTPVYYQSYGQLAELLRQQTSVDPKALPFIHQFVTHIEKTMSGNTELKQLCWEIFQQNEEAYGHIHDHFVYCQSRKLQERFEWLETEVKTAPMFADWAGRIETRPICNVDKKRYDLDVRVKEWPDGLWIKLYKHTWLGVFPYFLAADTTELARHLPDFTSSPREVPDWAGHYVASSGYQIKHERCIFDLGDKATDAHYNQALSKIRDCLQEIDRALDPTLPGSR